MNLRLHTFVSLAGAALALGGAAVLRGAPVPFFSDSPPYTSYADLRVDPSHAKAAGVIEGVVYLPELEERTPPLASPYARRRYRPPSSSRRGSLEDVVVFVVWTEAEAGTPPEGPAEIIQRNGEILPRVIPIQTGTRVEFPNLDDVYHNLFSLSSPQPFNLGRYPPGETESVTFSRPGVIRMFCDIHSDMSGVIHVLDTPYFTSADANGEFRIEGVPDGRHSLVAWHETAGTDSIEVVVSEGATARVELRPGRE